MIKKGKMIAKYLAITTMTMQVFVLNTYAQYTDELPDPFTGEDSLLEWVRNVLNLVIGLAGLIAVAVLVYSGILYIISSGDEQKIETATKGITYSIIGLVIAFISVIVVNFVLTQVLEAG